MADQRKTDAAQAEFKKVQRAQDGKKAMSEYEAEVAAVRAKTARLRAERLARDAALLAAPPAAATAPAKTARSKKKKTPAGKLSDWLDGQQDSGRNR